MPDTITSASHNKQQEALLHGGQLNQIALQYNIPLHEWLDLSTGIAPTSFPIPTLPGCVWQQLPQPSDALINSAREYYQTPHILPIAGSQVVIQILPQIAAKQGYQSSRVWIPSVGYQEHYKAWFAAGFTLQRYHSANDIALQPKDIIVLINPNNPKGDIYNYEEVASLFRQVKQQGGLLIIDEAFMDCTPEHSFIRYSDEPQLIVLRSIGKFFGLAGLRLGFVSASDSWLTLFTNLIGPWSVSGPAQYIGQLALADEPWQRKQRAFLAAQSQELAQLLKDTLNVTPTGTALFQTVKCEQSPLIFEKLCRQSVYVRLCDEKNALRFGIPNQKDLARLKMTLNILFS
ncbi:MAG: threonine-phosphate decarboxylase CobD [Paraglaciecola sp.]|uniref:threonine-phosphate decarboxylase CobD n=1 Tax=Paraglaciecola sp. TaxID=1920173 RepID=UPI0032987799